MMVGESQTDSFHLRNNQRLKGFEALASRKSLQDNAIWVHLPVYLGEAARLVVIVAMSLAPRGSHGVPGAQEVNHQGLDDVASGAV